MGRHQTRVTRNVPDSAKAGIVSNAALSYTGRDSYRHALCGHALWTERRPPGSESNLELEGMRLCGQLALVNRAGEE